MTLVSVGLPVFNGERFLAGSIDSALAQTHQDLELIISDNGSTDGTADICREAAAADARVRYYRQPENRGGSWNHNFVVHRARGDFFRWFSYDDVMAPSLLERCLDDLMRHPDVVLSFSGTRVIDDDGDVKFTYRTDLPFAGESPSLRLAALLDRENVESLLNRCYPVYGMMRRANLLATRLLRTHNSADHVLLVEMALQGPWSQFADPLFYSRRHAASSVGNNTPEQIARWFDPGATKRPMVRTALLRGYLDAIWRAPISPGERARCLQVVLRWLMTERNGRVVGSEIRSRAMNRIGIQRQS